MPWMFPRSVTGSFVVSFSYVLLVFYNWYLCDGWHLPQQSSRSGSVRFVTTWCPSLVQLTDVWQSYPETLFRKLFSSVPRRPFAVSNLTLSIEGGQILMIQGASSSGKSTILRLVTGLEKPVQGQVVVSSLSSMDLVAAQPVYIGPREFPDGLHLDERLCMSSLLDQLIRQKLCESLDKNSLEISPSPLVKLCLEAAQDLASQLILLCNLSNGTKQFTISQLSPSEFYRWGLVLASLQSILPSIFCTVDENSIFESDSILMRAPGPILLLDEWMDLETSGIVRTVDATLAQLAEALGAVVLCVTHKPHFFKPGHNSIVMCRGEILKRLGK